MNKQTFFTHHARLFILLGVLAVSIGISKPLYGALLQVQEYPTHEREFAKVTLNGTTVFSEVVRSDEDKKRGLSGRESLGFGNGMLFVFNEYEYHPFWMPAMRFPLDIIWIAGNRIVDIEEHVPNPAPGTPDSALPVYRPDAPSNLALEVEAGFAEANDLKIGQNVSFVLQREMDDELAKKDLENRKEELRRLSSTIAKEQLTIDALRKRAYTGRDFMIEKKLSESSAYARYHISYKSDGLTISGVMNVPSYGTGPYPVIILNHGYIDPEEYSIGRGSKREQDYFARHGYIAIQSDYRGYGSSSPDQSARYDFNVGYTIDVMNLIEALKKFSAAGGSVGGAKSAIIDTSRIGMWGHSMGGGVAERVMVLRNDIKAYDLFAPISANIADTLYLVQGKITDVERDYGITDETKKLFADASPLYYMNSVSAPVMIHHGTADKVVPAEFSKILNRVLLRNRKTALLFLYDGERHEFIRAWPLAMTRSLAFFDQFVKYPKKRK